MTRITMKPFIMGAAMGLMMLWMLHMALTGNQSMGTAALIGFVGVHLAIVAILLTGSLWLARLSPAAWAKIQRMHRPTLHHVITMILSAFASAGLVHLILHSGVA